MPSNAALHRLLCRVALCAVLSGAAAPALAAAKGDFPGPVEARVLRIIDGDTLVAEAAIWPGHVVTATIRLRGIDAPETRAACEEERRTAARAREALSALVGTGPVRISNISAGKYYGRVLADVETADGRGLTGELLARRLVRPYAGGRRQPWCE